MKTYNPIFTPTWGMPFIPMDYDIPPTLYSLCNSIVNFGKQDKTKIKDLASASRETIFNFSYPLSSKITKANFEKMIINHFMMRRIGFETFTAFQLALETKLNEIMPEYNILFDSLIGWDLFTDGEVTSLTSSDTNSNNTTTSDTTSSTADKRYSNTPQNKITDVQDGSYVTNYSYDQYGGTANGSSTSSGTASKTETITRSPADKIRTYEEFKNNMSHIYSMIFRELEDLFFQLV